MRAPAKCGEGVERCMHGDCSSRKRDGGSEPEGGPTKCDRGVSRAVRCAGAHQMRKPGGAER